MKITIDKDGQEVVEGTPEEIADYKKRVKEGTKQAPVDSGKRRLLKDEKQMLFGWEGEVNDLPREDVSEKKFNPASVLLDQVKRIQEEFVKLQLPAIKKIDPTPLNENPCQEQWLSPIKYYYHDTTTFV